MTWSTPRRRLNSDIPLSLWTYDTDLRGKLSSALYASSVEGQQSTPATVTFEYADQDLSVRKTFSFDNTYVVKVDTSVTYKGNFVAALPAWPAGIRRPGYACVL